MIKIGIGIRSTISISNTMKITARRKNRIENGDRADRIGSNPHSNGDSFSRLFIKVRVVVKIDNIYTSGGTIMATNEDIIISFTYLKLINFLMIKSHMLKAFK